MTDEDFVEFEIRRKPRWQRDGAGWILLYGPNRRRMGRVVPDRKHVGTAARLLKPPPSLTMNCSYQVPGTRVAFKGPGNLSRCTDGRAMKHR